MSMVALKEIRYSERQGKNTPGVSLVYLVHTTGTTLPPTTDPASAKTICDLVLGAVGSKSFFNSYIESKDANLQTGGVWEVRINLVDMSNFPSFVQTPLSEPARYSYSYEPLQKPVEKCYGAKLNTPPTVFDATAETDVVNSAGDPFDPTLETDVYLLTITAVKNELTRPSNFSTSVGCINSASMTVDGVEYPAYSLLFRYNGEDAYYTDASGLSHRYYINTYQYTFNKDLWMRQILDTGYAYLVSLNPDVKVKSEFVVRLTSTGGKDGQQGPGGSFGWWFIADKKPTTLPEAPS